MWGTNDSLEPQTFTQLDVVIEEKACEAEVRVSWGVCSNRAACCTPPFFFLCIFKLKIQLKLVCVLLDVICSLALWIPSCLTKEFYCKLVKSVIQSGKFDSFFLNLSFIYKPAYPSDEIRLCWYLISVHRLKVHSSEFICKIQFVCGTTQHMTTL